MYCRQCGTEGPEGASYCYHCGSRLSSACPQCGAALLPGSRSCIECDAQASTRPAKEDPFVEALLRQVPKDYAQRLQATRGQTSKERRVVTILFSDVKGSTAMAQDLDPEEVMETMDSAFDILCEPIARYEGTLARMMGDAILAFFGAPTAREDDAQRACLAALDIIDGAKAYAAHLEQEYGISDFGVRVGINTGLVVVGEVGSEQRAEYTAMGDAVNLAARMESAAEPGTVLITQDTYKVIASLFETESLGSIEVKGKTEPITVYRVLAAIPAAQKVRGIAGLESPLVGRESELATLSDAMQRLYNGKGAIVTIAGEAGIGKSRLVAEARKLRAHHLGWLEGRCLSYGASIAYLLWLDLLRALLGVTLEDGPGRVSKALQKRVRALCPDQYEEVYAFLARLLSLPLRDKDAKRLGDLSDQDIRVHTFAAIERLLACAALEQPLVVVCEDLHWADPTSLRLVEHLLPQCDRLPILFLCVFRPVREHPVWQLRKRLIQGAAYSHTDLSLEPLSAADSQALVSNLLWLDDLPVTLKERILDRAEGNPFYLEEVLRSLIDQAAIAQDGDSGRWRAVVDIGRIAIPDTLEGVLVARIDRLQEETRRVLQLASVIGRIFLYRVLAQIAAAEATAYRELALDRRLETLEHEQLIRERTRMPELEYIFKHDLTRQAAYYGLLKRDRRTYHRQVGQALEGLFPDRLEEMAGLLAHHWERADDAEKAVEYLQQAGDQARLAYAHEEAVDYYQRTLTFLEAMGELEQAARTQMKLGLTFDGAFEFGKSRRAYEAGFALWQKTATAQPATVLPPAPHALRLFMEEPSRLDPAWGGTYANQLFSGLVDHTPDLSIVPDVAVSWEVLDGGQRYLFRLREDVCWSDGTPVTAYDFDCAWRRLLDPAGDFEDANLLYDIRGAKAYQGGRSGDLGVRALDDTTLSVELEGPTGYFLHLLACTFSYPVPKHIVESQGEAWCDPGSLVTNGPFTLVAWQPGESMVLERNQYYHGRVGGNVVRVEITFLKITDRNPQVVMYEAGLSDVLQLPADQSIETMNRLRRTYASESISFPSANTGVLIFEDSRPPFDDARVRRAFAYALNREEMTDVVWAGYWPPATGGYVPPGLPGHVPGIALEFDPKKARDLLAEAGYPKGAGFPQVEMWWRWHEPEALQPLVDQWNDHMGLDLKMCWGERQPDLQDDGDSAVPYIHFDGWVAVYPDPDIYLRVAVQTFSTWRHDGYLDLVEQARRTIDQDKRMKLYAQAEKILAHEVPILPVDYDRKYFLIKPWVRKYPRSAIGTLFWKDVIIEEH